MNYVEYSLSFSHHLPVYDSINVARSVSKVMTSQHLYTGVSDLPIHDN